MQIHPNKKINNFRNQKINLMLKKITKRRLKRTLLQLQKKKRRKKLKSRKQAKLQLPR